MIRKLPDWAVWLCAVAAIAAAIAAGVGVVESIAVAAIAVAGWNFLRRLTSDA